MSELDKLNIENERYMEVLRQYADPGNWGTSQGICHIHLDEWLPESNHRCVGPDIAREALGLSKLEYYPQANEDGRYA